MLVGAGFLALQSLTGCQGTVAATATAMGTAVPTATVLTPTLEPCAYVWGYQDDVELTQKLEAEVRAIQPGASARVQWFGEECLRSSGSSFGIMETNFFIRLPVDDLGDHAALGLWMQQALSVLLKIPREEIEGKVGTVEFEFENKVGDREIARLPLESYAETGQTKKAAELFEMFRVAP